MNPVVNEPVLAAIAALVAAAAGVLVAFGVHLTTPQQSALRTLAEAAVVVAFVVRHQVTPTRKLPVAPAPEVYSCRCAGGDPPPIVAE